MTNSQIIPDEELEKKAINDRIYDILKNFDFIKYDQLRLFQSIQKSPGYQEEFIRIKQLWDLVFKNANDLLQTLESDTIKNVISEHKPILVKFGELSVTAGSSKELQDLAKAIKKIRDWIYFSDPFSSALSQGIITIDDKIAVNIERINLIMTTISNLIAFIAVIFTIFFFYYLHLSLIKPLRQLIHETDRVGAGDLTGSIKVDRLDEIGSLTGAFNNTIGELKFLIQQIYVAVIVISKILGTLFKSSNDVSESANAQATTIEQTRENFENLDSMIRTITEEAVNADRYTSETLEKVTTGIAAIENLEKEMAKIESSSQEITNIINLINDIAEQTELLSLNASIEAARAGEAGKGFNVVAGEVKKLAEKSTQSANRIYDLITNNTKIIQSGVNYSKQTANALKEISKSNEASAGIVNTINDEAQKIKQSSNEILGVINYIAEVAQVNLIEIEKITKATNDLGTQAIGLQQFVGQFDARSEEIKQNQAHIENLLKVKLNDIDNIFKENGDIILPTGNKIKIKNDLEEIELDELKLGSFILTNKNDLIDKISSRINAAVTFFQNNNNKFIRVSTTITNYDNTRAIGTAIPEDSDVYKAIIDKNIYFGRSFVVNRWYITVYKPIINKTGNIIGIISAGIPEEEETYEEQEDIEKAV